VGRDVTDEQRGRRPIFIATLPAAADPDVSSQNTLAAPSAGRALKPTEPQWRIQTPFCRAVSQSERNYRFCAFCLRNVRIENTSKAAITIGSSTKPVFVASGT
jgi:hypothetical protein